MVTSLRQNEICLSLLLLMSMKIRNTKMKMETFFMYSEKKVMMNTFKLLYDDKRCNFSFIRRERTCFVYKN